MHSMGGPAFRSIVEGTDKDRYLALLKEMRVSRIAEHSIDRACLVGVETSKLIPDRRRVGQAVVTQGLCLRHIADVAAGNNGFGYDPIFRLLGENMAELSPDQKCNVHCEAAGFMAIHS